MSRLLTIVALVLSAVIILILAVDSAITAPPGQRHGTRPGSPKYLPPPQVERRVFAAPRRARVAQPSEEAGAIDIAVPVRRIRLSPAVKGVPESISLLRGCR